MKRIYFLPALLLLAACEQDAPQALLGPAVTESPEPVMAKVLNDRFSFRIGVVNPCNNEPVDLAGRIHVTIHEKHKGDNGVTRFRLHANTQNVHGVGASGRKYNAPTNVKATAEVSSSTGTFEAMLTARVRLISQGSAPNFHGTLIVRVRGTEDAITSVEVIRAEGECRG